MTLPLSLRDISNCLIANTSASADVSNLVAEYAIENTEQWFERRVDEESKRLVKLWSAEDNYCDDCSITDGKTTISITDLGAKYLAVTGSILSESITQKYKIMVNMNFKTATCYELIYTCDDPTDATFSLNNWCHWFPTTHIITNRVNDVFDSYREEERNLVVIAMLAIAKAKGII